MSLAFAQPTEWWLEIPPHVQNQCWQDSQTVATDAHRQEFYLNQLCLQVFLPWFQQEYAPETVASSDRSIWDMVGGSCLTLGSKRLVLLPTDSLDISGLEVPQEWVDIPDWVADYYLAIQIDLDNRWLRVWGYTTHQLLKQTADYDAMDRTYYLPSQALNRDLNAFWLTYQLCPHADTQAMTSPLPTLSNLQLKQMIQNLSQSCVVFPRLAFSFDRWGALIQQADWRQKLYQMRLHACDRKVSIPMAKTPLNQWFQNLFADEWQSLETFVAGAHPTLNYNLRKTRHAKGFCAPRVKFVTLNADVEPQTVALLMVLNSEADGRMGVRVQVHPATNDGHVPASLRLAIYSEDGSVLQVVQAREQEDYMRLPHFRCLPGTQFQLQISLSDDTFSETFAV